MDLATQRLMQGAAGAGGDKIYVDDIFSTFLYKGNDSSITVNNSLDLSTEGGLVWVKNRTTSYGHFLFDTERGTTTALSSNLDNANFSETKGVTSFNSNGFTIGGSGADSAFNSSSHDYASWTFRKAPGFFDVVTWTGDNDTNRAISHNLESVPGMIIVKNTSNVFDWAVWHRSIWNTSTYNSLQLNKTDAQNGWNSFYGVSAPTSSNFYVRSNGANVSGQTYVAYVFAHDDQQFGKAGNASVIKCGSYTGNGSTTGPEINLGWEPQWIMIKWASGAEGWLMFDCMRGITNGVTGFGSNRDTNLYANENSAEPSNEWDWLDISATGFQIKQAHNHVNQNNSSYIYMAIRRSDGYVGKPPELGNQVFTPVYGSVNAPMFKANNHVVDFSLQKNSNFATQAVDWNATARLISGKKLTPNTADAEIDNQYQVFDYQSGMSSYTLGSGIRFGWLWKRYAGFDVISYEGNATAGKTITHSMNAVPEMMWIKNRDQSENWTVYHKGLNGGSSPEEWYLYLNSTNAEANHSFWNSYAPTSTQFKVSANDQVNGNNKSYIAMLFASTDVSAVGSYTGTGSSGLSISVGFQPRFILFRGADIGGPWRVLDSVRGMGSGNDKSLSLNTDAAQVTDFDWLDVTSTGWTINTTDGEANASNKNYIYYAHA